MQFELYPNTKKIQSLTLENEAEIYTVRGIAANYLLRMSGILLKPVRHARGGRFTPENNLKRMRSIIEQSMLLPMGSDMPELPVELGEDAAQFLVTAANSDESRHHAVRNPSIVEKPAQLSDMSANFAPVRELIGVLGILAPDPQ